MMAMRSAGQPNSRVPLPQEHTFHPSAVRWRADNSPLLDFLEIHLKIV